MQDSTESDVGVSAGKIIVNFVRPLYPENWWQLLFLFATILFLVAGPLPWILTPSLDPNLVVVDGDVSPQKAELFFILRFASTSRIGVIAAGLVTLWLSFTDGKQIGRRFFLFVVLPCLPAFLLNTWAEIVRQQLPHSVLDPTWQLTAGQGHFVSAIISSQGVGFWSAILGITLLASGILLVKRGLAVLPVKFAAVGSALNDANRESKLLKFALAVMILPYFVNVPLMAFYVVASRLFSFQLSYSPAFTIIHWIGLILGNFVPALAVFIVLKSESWKTFLAQLRLPLKSDWIVALLAPLAAYLIPRFLIHIYFQFGQYCHWEGMNFPPEFGSLFEVPAWSSISLIGLALLEELGWRGYMQPAATRQFGLRRGIFLVGLLWGVWHLPHEIGAARSAFDAVLGVLLRLANCICLSTVLGWLQVRSNGILSAAVFHGVWNILSPSPRLSNLDGRQFQVVQFAIIGTIGGYLWKTRHPLNSLPLVPPQSGLDNSLASPS